MHIVSSHVSAMVGSLALVYVVGAAREDAHSRGLDEPLRQKMIPLIAQFRKDGIIGPLFDGVKEVLGQDWTPQGHWADAILALLPKEQQ